MKQRAARKSPKPPPAPLRASTSLQYKVVELSVVDEASLEATVNHWVGQGWSLENVQFAMRESSKRPSMAFVFFARQSELPENDSRGAREKLARLVQGADEEGGF